MAGRKSDFTLPTLDDLFSTQEMRDDAKLAKIRDIPLELIDDFPDHPFKVRDDEDMMQLVESVKERGVITPATVRQKEDGRYELVSGHRRKRACELAGFETLRCEVVDLTRDEATILMVESNFQRSQILPSEKAFAYKMRMEAMKRQAGRPSKENTDNRLICYDILDLGKQLMPIGMLVVLDSILNRITQNRAKGKQTFIFIDEIYLLFQHEYSANFLFTLWKRVRKYGAYATGITQNVDDLLQSHTARTMLANSEFLIMLNQASTDRIELAKLLNISDLQLSYITNVDAGHGLIKVGSSLVPFANKFPKNTKLYKLMTTKPGEGA